MTIEKFKFLGNENISISIIKSIKLNNLSNSNILYGNKGIGKSTFVKFLACSLYNDLSKKYNVTSFNNHYNLILNNTHPTFKIIDLEINPKTNKLNSSISIDQIRNLESFIYQSSIIQFPKIILIDNSDLLNNNSSNALLKILEEPSTNTYFFLISHHLSNLISTIRSRCSKFKFVNPSIQDFIKIIEENTEDIGTEKISFLYDISQASPGLALEIYNENLIDEYENLINLYFNGNLLSSEITEFSDNISKKNNIQYKNFLFVVKFVLINLIKINMGTNVNSIFKSNINVKLLELSKKLNISQCIKSMEYINEYEKNLYLYNLDKRIFTLNLFSSLGSI